MNTLPKRMVEAGARAMWCLTMGSVAEVWRNAPPHVLDEDVREYWREKARACLTAALALAEAEGGVLTSAPERRETTTPMDGYNAGFNAGIAATLAGKVTL